MNVPRTGDTRLAIHLRHQVEELTSGAPLCHTCGEPSLRLGTDVQELAAVADALERHGDRYLHRLFTDHEIASSLGSSSSWTDAGVASLAARYAAKESVIKVLRPVHTGVDWRLVEIVREPPGWVTIVLHGDVSRLAEDAGLSAWALSFAHDGGVALATVLARHHCNESAVPDMH